MEPAYAQKILREKTSAEAGPRKKGAAKHFPTIATLLLEPRRLGGLPTGIEEAKTT